MKALLRLLCGLVDFIIITVVCQIVFIGLFGMPMDSIAPLVLTMMVFCIYNGLFVRYMHGQTPGKAVGRLVVIDAEFPPSEMQKPEFHALLLREACKALYLVPVVGWAIGLAAIVMIIFKREPLHDKVGKTTVIFVGRKKPD